ncbi:MAG: CBO0543 family protein [Bacillota bacterium]|nr:CBO0543 family protein [Bacillota bacterium]
MENAYELISQANKDMINLWLKHTLFGWQWWLGLALTIIPWVLWIILRKKESTNRLLFAGLFIILIASWLDLVGILFGLWSYYNNVIPFSPAFIPWDFTILPVIMLFFIQYKPNIKALYKAIIFSGISSFIAEPIFVLLGTYNPKHWKYIYSFPIMIVLYLVTDWISNRSNFEKLKFAKKK